MHRERLVARVQWARGGDEHARTSCVAPAEDVPDISCAPNAFECEAVAFRRAAMPARAESLLHTAGRAGRLGEHGQRAWQWVWRAV